MILDKDILNSHFFEGLLLITKKIDTAYDYFYKNELYLSKNVATAFEEAMLTQFGVLKNTASSFSKNLDEEDWQIYAFLLVDQKYFDVAEEKMSVLKESIYKELSYTHFDEMEKKEEALS